jgi:hypothetical protein
MNQPLPRERKKNLGREILFRVISLGLPLIAILILEGILRLVSFGDSLGLFIPNPTEGYEQYMIVNPVVGKKYFRRFEYTSPPNDIFLGKKPEDVFRIFVMGSSTVVGFPYENNLMFSRILHKQLEDAFPGKHIEVVNTAITAINSYTLLDFSRQIMRYDPDAILIYTGHNEFYGAFGVGSNESMNRSRIFTRMHFFFMDFRFYQMLGKIGSGRSRGPEVHGTLMKRMVGQPDIPYDSEAYNLAMKRYRQNMEGLLDRFRRKGIPVFISEVVSNVQDIKPFSAVTGGEDDEAWKIYREGQEAFDSGDYERAGELFDRARDLDKVRFRATGEVNEIIRELSRKHDAYLVPMETRFREESPHGIIGAGLITEHVHPNIRGCFLMARAFMDEILQSGIMGVAQADRVKSLAYEKRNWGYTVLDSLLAHHRITNLESHWPFVPADAGLPDYRLVYHPVSRLDSIAFNAFRDPGINIYDSRLSLAKEYMAAGDAYPAYREYEAILRTNPYLAMNYRDAATQLIALGNLPLALEYFKKSLEFGSSFYATYRIGEIYLIKGDYSNAREWFRKAFDAADEDTDRLKSLGKIYQACVYGGQNEDALTIAQQLQKYNATRYLTIPPKSYTYTRYIPYRTREQVQQAVQLMEAGQPAAAARVLEASLDIYDSHMARRYLGECYLQMGDTVSARIQLEQVKDEFAFDPSFTCF